MKIHYRSIGLHNNAGISFPDCYAMDAGPLDLNKTSLPTSGNLAEVSCLKCLRAFPKRYSWALVGKNVEVLRAKGILPPIEQEATQAT